MVRVQKLTILRYEASTDAFVVEDMQSRERQHIERSWFRNNVSSLPDDPSDAVGRVLVGRELANTRGRMNWTLKRVAVKPEQAREDRPKTAAVGGAW